jgi:lipoprotein-releasing system ATP-binding protein
VEEIIKLSDLRKTYRLAESSIEVLKGVNLSIYRGERLAIQGASGVGKSTLLHLVGTLDRPSGGQVLYEGSDPFRLSDVKLADFRNRHIGFVFQFHHLLPEFTALENTMMPMLIAGSPRNRAAKEAAEVLDLVGLGERLHHKPGEISGGEQQRVALARALIMKPIVLLADEPTGNLDPNTAETIHELLIDLNRETGITLVVVTHNESLSGLMNRRVTLLDGCERIL